MISELKPYTDYKESGLPWLGQVPLHWEVERTKWRFRHRKVLNTAGAATNVLSLTLRGVVNNNPDDPEGLVPKDYRTYQLFNAGDLVFKLIDLENLRTSRVGLVHEDGIMSSAYVRLVPSRPVNRSYFYHQFFDLYSRGVYNQLGAGVRSTLGSTDLLNITIAFPPPAEQAAIVRFLDWANGRLERAIRAKRKVIALLNEQKQAIIHHAVIRGLDPNVTLKPSGVPWLGDIPQHWDMVPARHLFRAVNRRDIHGNEVKMSVTQRRGLVPTAEMQETSTQAVSFDRFQLCYPNDLVLNKYKAHLGVFWAATGRGLITPNYTVFKPARILSTKYFEHLFHTQSYRDAFSMVIYGVIEGMCPLYTQDFYRIACVCPPHSEQIKIAEALIDMTKKEDIAISRLEREIDLLREYRTRLVADVVSGKVDVRLVAANLPDERPLIITSQVDSGAEDEVC